MSKAYEKREKESKTSNNTSDAGEACGELSACYAYLVRCADGTLYGGWTTDLKRRLNAHNSGKGAKYTRSRLPVELVYAERHSNKREAMSREYRIKHLSRQEKESLILSDSNILIRCDDEE